MRSRLMQNKKDADPLAGDGLATTLLTVGIVCVVAAVVGGGVSLLGATMPLINSVARQVVVGLFGLVVFGLGYYMRSAPKRRVKTVLRGALTGGEKYRRLITLCGMAGLPGEPGKGVSPEQAGLNAQRVRNLLVEIGARSTPPASDGIERWGLISRIGKSGEGQTAQPPD
jgi:hypothetical protein